MLKQLESIKVQKLEKQLEQAAAIIRELIGALDCEDKELRALIRDAALLYLRKD